MQNELWNIKNFILFAVDQFDHKYHAINDVTYGCFGWIDPVGGGHITFYVSDSRGYRPFQTPRDSVKVYPRDASDKMYIVNFASSGTFDKRFVGLLSFYYKTNI